MKTEEISLIYIKVIFFRPDPGVGNNSYPALDAHVVQRIKLLFSRRGVKVPFTTEPEIVLPPSQRLRKKSEFYPSSK